MTDLETFRAMALDFPETTEEPHFEKLSYRIKKKIFATLDLEKKTAVVKLTQDQQLEFGSQHELIIYPVKGAWGKQGWTTIDLERVEKGVLLETLTASYLNVAQNKLRKGD